jgi:hypothetical protein
MFVWIFTIQSSNGKIITKNPVYAEKRSKLGDIIFCKRETNFFKYHQ